MTDKEKKNAKDTVRKTAKGVYIVIMIAATLFGLVVLAAFTFIGIRLWQWLAPLFTNL